MLSRNPGQREQYDFASAKEYPFYFIVLALRFKTIRKKVSQISARIQIPWPGNQSYR